MFSTQILLLIIFMKTNVLYGTDDNEFSVVSSTSSSTSDSSLNRFQKQLEDLEKNDELIIKTIENEKFKLGEGIRKIQSLVEQQENTMEQLVDELRTKNENINVTRMQNMLDNVEREIYKMRSSDEQQEAVNKNLTETLNKQNREIKDLEEKLHKLEQKLINCTSSSKKNIPKDCKEVLKSGNSASGIYLIKPKSEEFNVHCEMNTSGGGWAVIHNRFDGSQNFDLNWTDYKNGFGDLRGEFWLGLDHIHDLTGSGNYELLVEMVNLNERKAHAYYKNFGITNEDDGYELKWLGGYEGDAGDSLSQHVNKKFSTKDQYQDKCSNGNCAAIHGGGWWFNCCTYSNLNGRYLQEARNPRNYERGVNWYTFSTDRESLMRARMMVRPKQLS